jgi:UPF0755 protein
MSDSDPAEKAEKSERPSERLASSGKRVVRERRRRRKRVPVAEPAASRGILFWAFTVLGGLIAVFAIYFLVIYPSSAGPGRGKEVELTLDHDEPVSSVIDKLDAAGLLGSRARFAIYARLAAATFAAGPHLLSDDAGPGELVRRLERNGTASKAKVTIPEGWNRYDIAKRLQNLQVASQSAFLDATADASLLRELALDGDSAEGFLFPATYDLPKDSDPREVVRRLVSEFERRFAALEQNHRLGRANLEATLGWSRREIVTLASMVEKEAAVDDERPIIASVFLNRLRDPSFKRKVLQCDPTAGYGCLVLKDKAPGCAGYTGKITHAVNSDPLNTYSTYTHEGLPPGPIANPGIKSMQAVLAPASTKYLYFVTRGEARRHAFSETVEEHNTAVKDLRDRTHPDAKPDPK